MDQLLVLPFDHRGSFIKNVFGISGREPTVAESKKISDAKRVIFDAYTKVLEQGLVAAQNSAILVDEQFGSDILKEAKSKGIQTCMCIEKSGQDEFDFEEGDPGYQDHILRNDPTYTKVLVRFNPGGDKASNAKQLARLKALNDYLKEEGRKLLFELLVPATKKQLESVGSDAKRYEVELRPQLTVAAIKEVQSAGIDPEVWKLEGLDSEADVKKVAKQIRSFNKRSVIVILGRGEDAKKAMHWLREAKKVDGVVGFAVGRTIFLEPIMQYVSGKIPRAKAVDKIAENYAAFVKLWVSERSAKAQV